MLIKTKLRLQFNQFLKSLILDELTSYEIKLINLITENFDSIASVGTAAGKRALLLNDLVNKNRDQLSTSFPKIEDTKSENSNDIVRINSIEIENFRGFASKESFNLDKPKILVTHPPRTFTKSSPTHYVYNLIKQYLPLLLTK